MALSLNVLIQTTSMLICVSTPFLFGQQGTPSPITGDESKVFNDMIVEEEYETESMPNPASSNTQKNFEIVSMDSIPLN